MREVGRSFKVEGGVGCAGLGRWLMAVDGGRGFRIAGLLVAGWCIWLGW